MPHRFSAQQLAIMRVLWERGRATVADVQDALHDEHPLAYSTVATVLARMERKGVIRHRKEGRTFIYEPLVAEQRIGRSLVSDLVERMFGGSPSLLVSHLLETQDLDTEEFSRIKALLAEHEAAQQQDSNSNGQELGEQRV